MIAIESLPQQCFVFREETSAGYAPLELRVSVGKQTHLQHVQEGGLAGVVETKEEQLGVLVQQPKGGEDIVDCTKQGVSILDRCW